MDLALDKLQILICHKTQTTLRSTLLCHTMYPYCRFSSHFCFLDFMVLYVSCLFISYYHVGYSINKVNFVSVIGNMEHSFCVFFPRKYAVMGHFMSQNAISITFFINHCARTFSLPESRYVCTPLIFFPIQAHNDKLMLGPFVVILYTKTYFFVHITH